MKIYLTHNKHRVKKNAAYPSLFTMTWKTFPEVVNNYVKTVVRLFWFYPVLLDFLVCFNYFFWDCSIISAL